jgi:DNA replication initiation complex subunit (GINS family)
MRGVSGARGNMAEINITYETLLELVRRETQRQELQELSPTFYKDLLQYVQSKKDILSKKSETFGNRKAQEELENIKDMIKKLYEKRERKILNMSLSRSRLGSELLDKAKLLPEEAQAYEEFYLVIERYRIGVLENLLKTEAPKVEAPQAVPGMQKESPQEPAKDDKQDTMVRFLQPVPRFLGRELEAYGPFAEDDIVSLPAEIATVLIAKGRAEEIADE